MSEAKPKTPLRLSDVRARLEKKSGPAYWRSLDELAGSEAFQELLENEFPQHASVWPDGVSRRGFLHLMGASLALAGVTACTRQPEEKILPYVRQPEQIVPGQPLYFATALDPGGGALGVLVESHMGRPTKIEGNPDHPASLGATDARTQAMILQLYDPDRSQVVLGGSNIRSWGAFEEDLDNQLAFQATKQGAGLRILTPNTTSPTLIAQMERILAKYPSAKWHAYDPLDRRSAREGARLAFQQPLTVEHRLEKADVIVSLDADFLMSGSAPVVAARQFSSRRVPEQPMNRLYVLESSPTLTGAQADHRQALRPGELRAVARFLAADLGLLNKGNAELPESARWVRSMLEDLKAHRGRSVVMAGDEQPAELHGLVHAINEALGNVGETVFYREPLDALSTGAAQALDVLTRSLAAGEVEVLLILGGNPAYDAPADLELSTHLERVGFKVHLGLYDDETSLLCDWHLPEAHPLECWGDTRSFDGRVSIQQPLIAPLYNGRCPLEVLALLEDRSGLGSHDLVREHWKGRLGEDGFEAAWRRAVHDGQVQGTESPVVDAQCGPVDSLFRDGAFAGPGASGMDLLFRADASAFDGRFANNGWLQELPRPLTKLTWDNAVLIAPSTAERLGLENEDVVELQYQGRRVEGPIWITPGQARDCLTVHLGYGRTRAGRVGTGVGFDAYALRTWEAPAGGTGVRLRKTDRQHSLVTTQEHHSMEGRDIVRSFPLAELGQDEAHAEAESHHEGPTSLYPEKPWDGAAWAMEIDLSKCVGCNACTIACQAENNIPVVGKEQVANGREMSWIRVDRYYMGDLDEPQTVHQPVPCMHCENAPCEPVCPVAATVHSDEGLNDMVYNRCVGTRYCANNCPYKVRRFNFFNYPKEVAESETLQRNPDVSVRFRGVMEKCTYCVQRISHARIEAKKAGHAIKDGAIVTACQQVCPSGAIVFGDKNDASSAVAKQKSDPRHYDLVLGHHLNTKPRTGYLAQIRNPNPAIEGA
ncbi:MAG: TAT-variant-translocated molybdopterin oxidoreductase [Planctomycetota bacterium]